MLSVISLPFDHKTFAALLCICRRSWRRMRPLLITATGTSPPPPTHLHSRNKNPLESLLNVFNQATFLQLELLRLYSECLHVVLYDGRSPGCRGHNSQLLGVLLLHSPRGVTENKATGLVCKAGKTSQNELNSQPYGPAHTL